MKPEYSPSHLDKLIELYFDGLTTLEQEAELRQLLRDPSATSRQADEARAVMSYAMTTPHKSSDRKHHRPARVASRAAAVIAVTAAAGSALLLLHPGTNATEQGFIAYVDGVRIDNEARVMEIVNADLAILSEATGEMNDDMAEELSALSNAFNN